MAGRWRQGSLASSLVHVGMDNRGFRRLLAIQAEAIARAEVMGYLFRSPEDLVARLTPGVTSGLGMVTADHGNTFILFPPLPVRRARVLVSDMAPGSPPQGPLEHVIWFPCRR